MSDVATQRPIIASIAAAAFEPPNQAPSLYLICRRAFHREQGQLSRKIEITCSLKKAGLAEKGVESLDCRVFFQGKNSIRAINAVMATPLGG